MTFSDLRKGVHEFKSRTGNWPKEARLNPEDIRDLMRESSLWPGGELPAPVESSTISGVRCYKDESVTRGTLRLV